MIVSWKTEISLHFFSHDTCKKLSNFWQKYFGKLVKIQVWVSRGTILRNKIFEKERSFSLFSYFEQKLLGLLARNCQNCRLRVQRNNCGMFFGKFSLLWLSEFEWRIVKLLAEKFRQACQIRNLSVQGNIFRRNYFFEKVYVLFDGFWTSSHFYRTLTRIFQYGCPNWILRVQGKSLNKNLFFWKRFIFFILVTLVKHLGLRANKLQLG